VIGRDGAGEPDEYDESHVCLPGNLWTVGLLTRMAWRFLGRRLHSLLYHTPWVIAFRMKEPDTESAADRVRFLLPGGNRQFADPFLFRRDERTFLFFEDCPCDSHTGVISCVEIDSAGRTTPVRPVLTADCHLSYPFVFEWQGEIYMLPETSRHRTVELYRAVDFPESWVFDRVLLDNLRAVDPTLLFHEGRYWLFVGTPSANGRMGEELSLYHAETPLGPWSAHPGNPVVNDVRRARPAGRVLRTEAGLIRPGQDHSVRYGYATSLCRIETLSTTEYRERVVGRIDPEGLPQAVCTHTLARDPRFEVIDLRLAVYRGIPWLRRGSAKRDAVLRAWSKVPTAWPNLDLSTSVANCAKMNA